MSDHAALREGMAWGRKCIDLLANKNVVDANAHFQEWAVSKHPTATLALLSVCFTQKTLLTGYSTTVERFRNHLLNELQWSEARVTAALEGF